MVWFRSFQFLRARGDQATVTMRHEVRQPGTWAGSALSAVHAGFVQRDSMYAQTL
jgi:hypothetical protein